MEENIIIEQIKPSKHRYEVQISFVDPISSMKRPLIVATYNFHTDDQKCSYNQFLIHSIEKALNTFDEDRTNMIEYDADQ